MKRCSVSLLIRQYRLKQNKISLQTIRMVKIKTVKTTNAGVDIEKLDHLDIIGGSVKLYSPSENSLTVSYKVKYAVTT